VGKVRAAVNMAACVHVSTAMRCPLVLAAIALVACTSGESEPTPIAIEDTGAAESSIADSTGEDVAIDTGTVGFDSAVDETTIDTFAPGDTGTVADTTAPDTTTIGSGWTPLTAVPTGFAARRSHSAVWTGTSMIVWGGCAAMEKPSYGDGASYDPATSSWKLIKDSGLAARYLHAAAWSGTEMLIIGGILAPSPFGGYTVAKDGALYDPSTDSWSPPVTLPGATRYSTVAVWSTTTSEFLVWGGFSGSTRLGDGYAYKPSTKTWRTMSAVGAPTARNGHEAAWTGTRMIVIGGAAGSTGYYAADAYSYDPVADTWETLTPPSGYIGRIGSTPGLSSGGKIAFWGGRASWKTTDLLGDGLLFDSGSLTAIAEPSATILPNPKRENPAGWWSGARLFVWGGRGSEGWVGVDTGASFDLATKAWTAMPTAKAPSARYAPTAVVNTTNGAAYVWGGYNGSVAFADGATFRP
jgi:N-acetylneuraminic acid mutarotase